MIAATRHTASVLESRSLLAFLIAFGASLALTPLMRYVAVASGILDRPAGAELVHEAQEPSGHGLTSFVAPSVRARCGARIVSGSRRDEQLLTEG